MGNVRKLIIFTYSESGTIKKDVKEYFSCMEMNSIKFKKPGKIIKYMVRKH